MHTANVYFSNGSNRSIVWDSFQIHGSGLLMVFERRGYPDKYLPLHNVLYIDMGD